MLKMRLQRTGRKNNPSYRVVVTDSRNAVSRGRSVDLIGSYDPKMGRVQIDKDKATHWLSHGVQPSDTVYNMLIAQGIVEGRKKNVLPKKSPIIDEAKIKAEAEAKAAEEAAAKAEAEKAAALDVAEEAVVEETSVTEEPVAA
ncbi:30S ribosomal protein S16 [Candidatus Kaiserbacteria bacterium]|nr:30S ribosomal protein S16 [Candidatus Kaiserbacteria bacterium]NCT01788.1 30S ribosomal protein S16 [Candidatus Parcubacteria bacterium]